MSFRNNSNFIDNGVMVYTCDHCELVFSDKTELLLHVKQSLMKNHTNAQIVTKNSQILTTLEYI